MTGKTKEERILTAPELPIPVHLQSLLRPLGQENSEYFVQGDIVCACGGEAFVLAYVGVIEQNAVAEREHEGYYYLAIRAECPSCGARRLLFDENRHGWAGFVCHEAGIPPYQAFETKTCPACGGREHRVILRLRSWGKEDFIEESGLAYGDGSPFKEADWVNAFEWIALTATCARCGRTDENWLDYEAV